MKATSLGFVLALSVLCPIQAIAQESTLTEEETAAEIARLLHYAREGSPVVRPQAARKLLEFGARAAEELVRDTEGGPAAVAKQGPALVAVLTEFGDARLRQRVWQAVLDRDFPWRPAAAMALAGTGAAGEADRLIAFASDPIALVRLAGLEALEVLELRERAAVARAALSDPDDRVRRRAAVLLDGWGERTALFWLVEELRRDDHFFGTPTGRIARYESAALLAERAVDLGAVDLGGSPTSAVNEAALASIEQRVLALAGGRRAELPEVARAITGDLAEVIGLEVRSCRRGEFALRIDGADTLWVGMGNPARIALPPGTSARLIASIGEALEGLEARPFWGSPGCDAETFYWRPVGAKSARILQVSKGPEAVSDLRPAELGRFARLVVDAIPEEGLPPRAEGLRERLADALLVTGGALPESGR